VSGKDLFDKHGARKADREHPWGWGPYKLKDVQIGERIVLEKYAGHPDVKPENPDVLIFRIMREAEQRVTALLNGEIQVAQYIPPHLAKRIEGSRNAKLVRAASNRIIFLAMSPKHKPWDSRLMRQAVCHALDRRAIIEHVLNGFAEPLQGPIGPGQYGYDADFAARRLNVPYDPEKAKKLVAQSGYKGEPVELVTTVGRFINDKQVTQSMIPMLNAAGINARLSAPDYSFMWPAVQKGKIGFFYIGRGGVVDPSVALSQYFETGGSPRIGISDPAIDAAMAKQRVSFDPAGRKVALNEAFKAIVDAAPACFLWRHSVLTGLASQVDHDPDPSNRIFGVDIAVRQ
jgi:peptide/nickel transport system substrate-binding protein